MSIAALPIEVMAQEISEAKWQVARDLLEAYDDDRERIATVASHADHAVLAWAAYGTETALDYAKKQGWSVEAPLTNENMLAGDTSATLFVSDKGAHVLAFRGTTGLGDWVTNTSGTLIAAPLLDAQIQGALEVIGDVVGQYPDVTFTGHSLGGRLAHIGLLVTGRPAVVFNAAPLGLLEVVGLRKIVPDIKPGSGSGRIAFRSPADALTALFPQDDIVVSNIVVPEEWSLVEKLMIVDNLGAAIQQLKYNHMAEVLARAMQTARAAHEGEWFDRKPDGDLCRTAPVDAPAEDLADLTLGSTLEGRTTRGTTWTEYLATNKRTLLVGSSGNQTAGSFRYADNTICFSYDNTATWGCKTLRACESGEGAWVIVDGAGHQTSLLTRVTRGTADDFHRRNWSRTAGTQFFNDPRLDRMPRTFTALPASVLADVQRVQMSLAEERSHVEIDAQRCMFTRITRTPIVEKVLSAGGWSDVLGNTRQGRKTTHVIVDRISFYLERLAYAEAIGAVTITNGQRGTRPAVNGYLIADKTPSFLRMDRTETWPQKPEKNSVKVYHSVSLGRVGMSIASNPRSEADAREIAETLNRFAKLCRGEVVAEARPPAPKAAPQPVQAAPTPQTVTPVAGTLLAGVNECVAQSSHSARLRCFDKLYCRAQDNDLDRLGCYDDLAKQTGGPAAQAQTAAQGSLSPISDADRARILAMVRKSDSDVTASFEGCILVRHYRSYNSIYKGTDESYRAFDLSVIDIANTGQVSRGTFGDYLYRVVAFPGETFLHRGVFSKDQKPYLKHVRDLVIAFDDNRVKDYEIKEFDTLLKAAARFCQLKE